MSSRSEILLETFAKKLVLAIFILMKIDCVHLQLMNSIIFHCQIPVMNV